MEAADGKHEFEGEVLGFSTKGVLFRGDYWDRPEHACGVWFSRKKVVIEFHPKEQGEPLRATVLVPAWIARNDKLADYE